MLLKGLKIEELRLIEVSFECDLCFVGVDNAVFYGMGSMNILVWIWNVFAIGSWFYQRKKND